MPDSSRGSKELVGRAVEERLTLREAVRRFKRQLVLETLKHEQGHCGRTAARLGIHRNVCTRLLKDAHINTFEARRLIRMGVPLPGRLPGRMLWTPEQANAEANPQAQAGANPRQGEAA